MKECNCDNLYEDRRLQPGRGSVRHARSAQEPVGQGGRKGKGKGKGPAQFWWVERTTGGIYKPPMRPLWKLSDLKMMHAGQSSWQEQIILDPEQDATYNGAAPGTKFTARMHPDTPTVFVVVAGSVRFMVEGQPQPANGRRGSIVNIMKGTIFSYEVLGDQTAYWVEVNPTNYKTVYPVEVPARRPSSPMAKSCGWRSTTLRLLILPRTSLSSTPLTT